MSDSGNFIRKECSQSLDRSSARTLWVPGRWTAASLKLPNASAMKIQCHLSRCIICLSLLYLLYIADCYHHCIITSGYHLPPSPQVSPDYCCHG